MQLPPTDQTLDAIIVGGGPAGLTAAIYLGRFRRNVLVFHAGKSRAALVPVSHNHAGFPNGIRGTELLERMWTQAVTYSAHIVRANVKKAAREEELFKIATTKGEYQSRLLLLATGVVDVKPDLPHLTANTKRGLVRYCPVCDAFEAINKRIVVIGSGDTGLGEADFLTTYSKDISVLTLGQPLDKSTARFQILLRKNVKIIEKPIVSFDADAANETVHAHFADGTTQSWHIAYAALGCHPRNELAVSLGAELTDDHRLKVNDHRETTVPGCFAAGDIVKGLNQISVAMGDAAIAATAMHNRLREQTDEESCPYPKSANSIPKRN